MVEQQKSGLTTIPLFRGRIIDPSYNNTPDYSNQLRVTASYLLSSQTLLFLEYLRFESERDSVRHLINDSETVLDYGEREGAWDHILASVTTSFTPEISLTMSWFYQRWKVQQDLAYRWWQGADFVVPYVEHGVPYQDISNSLSLSLQFMPQEDLTFIAGVSYVITDGESGLGDSLTDAPFAPFLKWKQKKRFFPLMLSRGSIRNGKLGSEHGLIFMTTKHTAFWTEKW